jgi:hypothetical protein
MHDGKHRKAVCPICNKDNTHKRKRAPGSHYCSTCKVAFRDPLIIKPNVPDKDNAPVDPELNDYLECLDGCRTCRRGG